MRIDRFTSKLQGALADAQSLAVGKDHNQVMPVHLLLALLDQQGGSTKPILNQMGVDVPAFREKLSGMLDKLAQVKDNYGDVQMPDWNRRACGGPRPRTSAARWWCRWARRR